MSNYAEFREEVGINNGDMIRVLRGKYRRYGKATNAMVNNPENYGVCLCPDAEKLLAATFGSVKGLNVTESEASSFRKKTFQRTKPNRLSVYLNDEMYGQIKELMSAMGFATVQEFLLSVIEGYLGG